jgi:hypothetical protein
MTDTDQAKTNRVMAAMLPMKRLDLAALQRAYKGDQQGDQQTDQDRNQD